MVDILDKFFTSVFTREDILVIPDLTTKPFAKSLTEMRCTRENVSEVLTKLKPHSAHGPDGIPTRLLHDYAFQLAGPLTHIYNSSLSTGIVPSDWRLANGTPIYKKGKKCDPSNYRPISLTSVACEVLEEIIKQKIVTHLDSYIRIPAWLHLQPKHGDKPPVVF